MTIQNEQWQQLCNEHQAALDSNVKALGIINGKFSDASSNPTTEEIELFEASEKSLFDIKQKMRAFLKRNA